VGDGGHRDAEFLGHSMQRLTASNGRYQGSTTLRLPLCLLMGRSPQWDQMRGIWPLHPFGMYWH
jgi:hypothetical protein